VLGRVVPAGADGNVLCGRERVVERGGKIERRPRSQSGP
jgi:hypothetical protein